MSTNTKISSPIIKKFDGENYHLWAFKMKCYLMAKNLWEYVDPDANTGITTMTAENNDFFRKTHAALILHLEDNQLIYVYVISLEWAREVWVALAVIHHTSSISSKLNIKEMFNTFCYQSTNMKEHLIRFQHIVVRLNAAGCNVAKSDLVARLLQSLPSEYDPLVQAIRLYVNEVTLRRLIGAIQGATHRIENDKAEGSSIECSKGIKAGKVENR
jgi:hypothetical protein